MARVTRGSYSVATHPHTNNTCLYSEAARRHCPLAGSLHLPTKGWPGLVDLGARLSCRIGEYLYCPCHCLWVFQCFSRRLLNVLSVVACTADCVGSFCGWYWQVQRDVVVLASTRQAASVVPSTRRVRFQRRRRDAASDPVVARRRRLRQRRWRPTAVDRLRTRCQRSSSTGRV